MSKQEELIKAFKELPVVQRYLELEKGINEHPLYHHFLEEVKSLQRKTVLTHDETVKNEYNMLLTKYCEQPFMAEYLEAIDEINGILKMIKAIIEDELHI